MRVELVPDKRGKWYVRLVGDNNRKLNKSQPYFSKWNAKRAAKKMFPDLEPIVVDG